MNNRKWNAKNPNQGIFERVLCVCSAGLLRSPSVAAVMAARGCYNTRAAGLEKDFALIPVDDVLLEWADSVVVMDFTQAERISEVFDGPIYNFSLPDEYEYMHPDLVSLIEQRIQFMEQWRYN
jgi:predicted protein tyrosine phosphatase